MATALLVRSARTLARPFSAATPSSSSSSSSQAFSVDDPSSLYRSLLSTPQATTASNHGTNSTGGLLLQRVLESFSKSSWASTQSLALYLPRSFFPTAASRFRSFLLSRPLSPDLLRLLSSSPDPHRLLFPLFAEFCLHRLPRDLLLSFRSLVLSGNLTTSPHVWFPFARAMRRRIVYHCGPTNSGKTFNALQRFMSAPSALYCGPLRLLAMEVFDKVNSLGVYCSLVTGQEKKLVPFASHVACTVEMASVDDSYDVAVLDEIQMAADPARGHAWTRALLGLRADEIHLCGDPSVLPVIRRVCRSMGDDLVERRYARFKPLVVESRTLLGDLRNVQSGDCVVAFSRLEIFEVKLAVERSTSHRCCVIYGALPPETRRQQANLFNAEGNGYDVLVASDAIGMGLNLNIRRVVFFTLSKYNGNRVAPIPASQVKQIAGRAGRRSCRYPDGLVTTLHKEDLDYLIECLKRPTEEVRQIGLFPYFEHLELFAAQYPNLSFPQLLDKLFESCNLDSDYFLCQVQHVRKVAQMLEKVLDLSLEDRFNFCFAPVNVRDPKAMYHLLRFASRYSQKLPVNIALGVPRGSARNDFELLDLETKHQIVSMYLWLSQQFGEDMFPFKNLAEVMSTNIVKLLGESLANVFWKPESRNQGNKKSDQRHQQDEHNTEEEINNPDIKKGYDGLRPQTVKSNAGMVPSLSELFQKRQVSDHTTHSPMGVAA